MTEKTESQKKLYRIGFIFVLGTIALLIKWFLFGSRGNIVVDIVVFLVLLAVLWFNPKIMQKIVKK